MPDDVWAEADSAYVAAYLIEPNDAPASIAFLSLHPDRMGDAGLEWWDSVYDIQLLMLGRLAIPDEVLLHRCELERSNASS